LYHPIDERFVVEENEKDDEEPEDNVRKEKKFIVLVSFSCSNCVVIVVKRLS